MDNDRPVNNKKHSGSKKKPARGGRPVTNDIMNLQGSIPATPEQLAKVILSTPPKKVKA